MPELIAKTALEGRSETLGGVTLAEVEIGAITSISVFPGGAKAVSKALKPMGLSFPAPNEMRRKAGLRLVWTGRDQAFLIGAACPLTEGAALTDQSGGWTCLSLSGAAAAQVLARLVPVDLGITAFPVGHALRAPLNHMNAVLMRMGPEAFDLLVFRSMARTAWHELHEAMRSVEARSALR